MKKLSILALCVLGLSLCANSANYGGKKFYINPGHGGHDSDDRPTALPLSVPMFYESDGNLDRGLHLYDFIINNGGAAKLSRTTNNSSDDLALSTIAAYSNSYGGYFISLHSNGANASANYICAMFRSEGNSTSNSNEAIAGSKAMATAAVNWQDAVTLSNQTYETPRVFADYPFYGYHLGVLRTNDRPGYLIETWFHDYRPEALRMKSTVYNKFLAWQIARASLDSPGGTGTLQAVVQGDIRDLSKSCGYTNYTTRGRDQYKAVNGATVELLNSSGTVVSSMTTDNCENGYYAFFIDSTGSYTIKVTKSGYKTATKTVNVSALSTQQTCTFDLTEGVDEGISVSPAAVDFGKVTIGTPATASVTVTGNSLTSSISASINSSDFSLSTSSLAASGGTLTITCSPASAGAKSATLTLTSGSFTKTVLVNASAVNPPLKFTEIWNYSETSGVNASWTSDKAALRNMCYGNGKLFVVKPSAGEILVIDARTAQQVGTVNTTGVEGGTYGVMDVQYVNGKLLATNLATVDAPLLKVYVWNDGYDAAPSVLLNTTDLAGFTRMGDTFSVKGDLTSGELLYAAGNNAEDNKIVKYALSNGVASTTPTTITITDGTQGIKLGSSPRVEADRTSNKYWVNGQNYYASLVSAEGMLEYTVNSAELKNVYQGNSFATFEFRGSSYGAALTYLPADQSATGETITAGRAVLFDGTNGWASAENIGEYPAAGLGTTRNTSFSSNIAVNVDGEDCVEMWVLVNNQGVAYYRYGTISGPTVSASTSSL
ncbi:MAG: N-acetylmuramoyl-L-alanine amidase, partial [Candidatus Limisoma sp.]